MVKTIVADDTENNSTNFFLSLARDVSFAIGLLLGQTTSNKDYIVHFAKTPPLKLEDNSVVELKKIEDVDEEWVTDHARQASRMLPGGMHVLGIFVICNTDLLNPFHSKIKSILTRIYKTLGSNNKYLYGNPEHNERLALNYCIKTKSYSCKAYDVSIGTTKNVDFKFQENAFQCCQVTCKYQINQVYKIQDEETDWPLKQHMGIILEEVYNNLKKSVFLYDNDIRHDDDSLEGLFKGHKKLKGQSKNHEENSRELQVTILQPCIVDEKLSSFRISKSSNKIRILGHVAVKLFLNTKMNMGAVSEAIIQDIMRSLSSRLEMHWDSLTEEEHAEDVNSVHEPPRRVMVALPHNKITISDYLFPGEGVQDAQVLLEETMSIKIRNKADFEDVEGQADLSQYCTESLLESDNEENDAKTPSNQNQNYYICGLGVAILVLMISLVIHFMQV